MMAMHEGRENAQLDRREREKLARREEILEAARRVFAGRGFHAATLDEIAAEAGFSKGALYGYFESKEELYATIIEEEFDRATSAIRKAIDEHQDPLDILKEIIRQDLIHHAERKELFGEFSKGQARLTSPHGSKEGIGWRLMGRFRVKFFASINLLSEVVEAGVQSRQLRADIPRMQLAVSLLGLVHSSFLYWLVSGSSESVETTADRAALLFFKGACPRTEEQ